jgi:class 3 adenylate cyclase
MAGNSTAQLPVSSSITPEITVSAEAASVIGNGERKTVTALFVDIKGSMELMENLDPEEARAIIDPALKLMIEAVHSYGGHIIQSTGDGIFALFGAPVTHEDHLQRALYAALRMQAEMGHYATRLRQAGQPPIEARVGLNTGEVVARLIATGDSHAEYTPIGHSASVAAQDAGAGTDRINRGDRHDAQALRRILHVQGTRPHGGERGERAGRGV